MDVDTTVQVLKWRLSRFTQTAAGLTDDMLLAELNLAMQRAESKEILPWFLRSGVASEDIQPNEERVQLPTNFLIEDEESDLWLERPDGSRLSLKKREYDDIRNEYKEPSDAGPVAYAIIGNYFRVRPVTTAVGFRLQMIYLKKSDALVTGGDEGTTWLKYYPDMLLAGAGRWLARFYLQNSDAYSAFSDLENEVYDDIVKRESYRETVGADPTPED